MLFNANQSVHAWRGCYRLQRSSIASPNWSGWSAIWRRPRRCFDLPTPLWQILVDPAGAGCHVQAGCVDRGANRQQFQLLCWLSRRLYTRPSLTSETQWDEARSWLRDAIRSAKAEIRHAGGRARRDAAHAAARAAVSSAAGRPVESGPTVAFPNVRTDRDVSRLAQEVSRAARQTGGADAGAR